MRKKNMVLVLVMVLVIGFATVSTTLYLNGTIGITTKKDDFDVIFTKAILDGVDKNEFIDSATKKTITFTSNELTTLNDTTTLQYEVTNKSRLYDANVTISCTPIENEYVDLTYIPTSNNMIVEAGKTEIGSITARLKKVSTEDKEIKVECTLNVNGSEREDLGEKYIPTINFQEGFSLKDANDNGVVDIGEEIQVGTESFYVMSNENNEIDALAKYNLNVGSRKNSNITEGIQQSGSSYSVAFSNSKGWPYGNNDTIDIKSYDGPVKDALYGANGYESYVQNTIPTATVRLIIKSEIESIDAKGYSWLYNTSYWTQSASFDYDSTVWCVSSYGSYFTNGFDYGNGGYGVRPVITISLS